MKTIHPKTGNTLIMIEESAMIADVEKETDVDGIDYLTVTIGHVGYSDGITIYRDNWDGFKRLIDEVDRHWKGVEC